MIGDTVITLDAINAHYGASHVLHDVDLVIKSGTCVSLLGRNGMGKTTTLKIIMGLLNPTSGTITRKGMRASRTEPHLIGKWGVGYVPEGREIFPNLSVHENLLVAARFRSGATRKWDLERVLTLFPKLTSRLSHLGAHLSGGEQQMLSIGRALMTNPDILLLDEVTEGLAPLIREEIWAVIEAIKVDGITIVVIDKDVSRLAAIADNHLIIVKGTIVFDGDSATLLANPKLLQRHLGV
ncbi:MAG: ABC transporter ATP-binding protein [Rhodospirillaceae bacterium TMED8]|nr:ABC transporter ATP-binding protein [Magnetovibrio sp.]OUT48133.1 MAG: ABC transporter ATP-binding protein [Rhodospirillaceae bacterium TMED8]|tara:strand:+ start:9988 stop:10704 length:717 start_codon:yes stop_codon:yes gene_type:complete